MIKKNGLKYFYKGYFNSLFGIAVFRGSFNGIYDSIKYNADSINLKALYAYLSTVAAGFISYPFDIIRKRRIILNNNENIWTFSKNILKN